MGKLYDDYNLADYNLDPPIQPPYPKDTIISSCGYNTSSFDDKVFRTYTKKAVMYSPSVEHIDASIKSINAAINRLNEAKSDLMKMRHKITITSTELDETLPSVDEMIMDTEVYDYE